MSFRATYEPTGDRFYAVEHSLAHFLTERHRYYTESSTGELRYAAIDHEQWPLYDATVDIEANALFAANGFPVPQSDPVHLFSPGVDTIATRSKRVEP